jgi:membrane-associated phospholipid phosphatase
MKRFLLLVMVFTLIAGGCQDGSVPTQSDSAATLSARGGAVKFWEAGSSVRWNRIAIDLFRARGGPSGRIMAYLSLAQYRAVLAAQDGKVGSTHPSLAGAAAGASVVVLKQFFPLDAAALEAELEAQRLAIPEPGKRQNFAAGEAIGRKIGTEVLAFAATDNFGVLDPGSPPVGPGFWTSSGAPIVRGGYGARPFFLTSGSELRSPPPPAFGSPEFLTALAEVRAVSDNRTAEQLAIAQKWAPFGDVVWNEIATDLIVKHRRNELQAARILAYANAASFDAIIACFDTKFTYWFIRPSQADPAITTPIGLPNHPSYPSAHSCATGAWMKVLGDAFPNEKPALAAYAREASLSRLYAGIHYRFDLEAGEAIGREAGRLARLRGGLE